MTRKWPTWCASGGMTVLLWGLLIWVEYSRSSNTVGQNPRYLFGWGVAAAGKWVPAIFLGKTTGSRPPLLAIVGSQRLLMFRLGSAR